MSLKAPDFTVKIVKSGASWRPIENPTWLLKQGQEIGY